MPSPDDIYLRLVETMPVGVIIWELASPGDPGSLSLKTANAAASQMLAMDLASCVGRRMRDLFPAVRPEREREYFEIACGRGQARHLGEVRYTGAQAGVAATFSVTLVPVAEGCVGVLFESLTVERTAEKEARTLSAFLDSIIENIPVMVFVKEAETLRFERLNRAGEELLGQSREAMLGKNDYDFFPSEQADFFQSKDREVLRSKRLMDIPEEPIQTPQGQRWLHTRKIPLVDAMGEPRYLLGISEDITTRKQTEEALREAHRELEQRVAERTAALSQANAVLSQEITDRRRAEAALRESEEHLRQSQKMEAIGRLAGGVAHDFNNLLSIILSYGEIVTRALPPKDPLRDDLLQITIAGERARDLTRQLLAFSRRQVLQPEVIDLGRVVLGLEAMLGRLLGEDIELRVRSSGAPHMVKADPGQIEQIILNLAVNSRDAMPGGGKLTIETAAVKLDESYARDHVGVKPGPYVMLAVTDSGHGMDKAVQARIFEPFFTTKEKGKGTGLGLSTVFGIVQQSGGHIWVYSEPGRGSTFKTYLPRTDEKPVPESAKVSSGGSLLGMETILLVEDEQQVRVLAHDVLREMGYNVLAAQNAGEALLLSEQYIGVIHLLLTDVVMPQVGGRELARRLAPSRPKMKVLYMSGYTDDAIVHHGILESGIAFLEKPITPESLARKVRSTLDRKIP